MKQENSNIRFAIPLAEGRLCMHFGHCQSFALVDVHPSDHSIVHKEEVAPPPHAPGVLPAWLAERGVRQVIAGGMGRRALDLFREQGIEVRVGAPAESPEYLVSAALDGSLECADNVCDH